MCQIYIEIVMIRWKVVMSLTYHDYSHNDFKFYISFLIIYLFFGHDSQHTLQVSFVGVV